MVSSKIRVVPSDVDAEEAVLASILVDDDAIFKVQPELDPPDFFKDTAVESQVKAALAENGADG